MFALGSNTPLLSDEHPTINTANDNNDTVKNLASVVAIWKSIYCCTDIIVGRHVDVSGQDDGWQNHGP